MTFWKTSFLAAISTVARLASSFVVAKIIAVFCGPAAFGLISQFQSFVSLIQLGSGGVVNSGVTKYVAEYKDSPDYLRKIIETATKLSFISSIVTGFFIICFSSLISDFIFHSKEYLWVIAFFGATLFSYSLNQILLSVLNGIHKMNYYAIISIVSSFFSIIFVGILSYFFQAKGAIVGSISSQAFLFLFNYFFRKIISFKINIFKIKINKDILKKLLNFSLMAVTSAVVFPITQMILRDYVASHSSWSDVGCWQGVVKISDAYLMILITIISTYALPKYSQIKEKNEFSREVIYIMCRILPFCFLFSFLIYIYRDYIIILLFSDKFFSMRDLFLFQLLGDIAKISSWIIASIFIAKTQIKIYIFSEIIFSLTYLFFSFICFNYFSIQGLTLSFCINYFFYFLFVSVWFWRFLK